MPFYDPDVLMTLDELAAYGKDARVSMWAFFRHPGEVRLGSHVLVDAGVYCTTRLEMGDYVHVAPYVTIVGGGRGLCRLGHFSTVAAGARIVCVSNSYDGSGLLGPQIPEHLRDGELAGPVVLKPFAAVGTNAVLLPGVTVGEGAVVAAGAVVNRSLAPWGVYAGVRARRVGDRPSGRMLECAGELGYVRGVAEVLRKRG